MAFKRSGVRSPSSPPSMNVMIRIIDKKISPRLRGFFLAILVVKVNDGAVVRV